VAMHVMVMRVRVRHEREMHAIIIYVSIRHAMATHVSGNHVRAKQLNTSKGKSY
jgi:hypothetical protein